MMKIQSILQKIVHKLYYKQWIIGVYEGSIQEIIETKTFDPKINWIESKSLKKFDADPFLLSIKALK